MSETDPTDSIRYDITGRDKAEKLAEETAKMMARLCDSSMPKKHYKGQRRQQYWWTDEIADLRRTCLESKRKVARARGGPGRDNLKEAYRTARKRLTETIKDSKIQCWRKLCDEVEHDPWGTGYKIVIGKLRGLVPPEIKDAETTRRIVDGLFPTHQIRTETINDDELPNTPNFTEEELVTASLSLRNGKAPGADGVPGEILKLMVKLRPHILLNLYNTCLTTGTFSRRWKKAVLILIPKGKGDPDAPSAYRPLSLLDTTGKLYELIIKTRLTRLIENEGGLSEQQYGFRKGRSTIGAIQKVVNTVQETERLCHAARPIVLLATLDVRNAFNSARWVDILDALKNVYRIPPYLFRVLEDYLRDRSIIYETTEGRKTIGVTAGVAQGSILGPDFWNVIYDDLLRMEMPPGTSLVAYADDVAALIEERTPDLAQYKLNQVMRRVTHWMTEHGLQLATEKTELLILTRRRIRTILPMTVVTETVMTRSEVKYLGVTLDTKLSFWPHIHRTANRAAERIKSLSRLMANTNGPKQSKRKLLMATTHSMLLYGAEIWADVLKTKKYSTKMTMTQRLGALRIASAYRTVSAQAVLVVASVIPIDLLALERKRIYKKSAQTGRQDATETERQVTMRLWQERWDDETRCRWTRTLIRDLKEWTERDFGEVNFYLTQFLTGHGYYRKYLHRMNRVRTPDCKYCGHDLDDTEHTFFVCEQWTEQRQRLEQKTGSITPNNIIEVMLTQKEWWDAVATFVENILRAKNADGCLTD